MDNSPEALQRRIAELEALLREHSRFTPTAETAARDKVADPQGTVNVDSQGRINGVAVGVNLGTIIYGHAPEEDERRRLVWYLDRLAAKLNRLPLRGLDKKLDRPRRCSAWPRSRSRSSAAWMLPHGS